ncbi:MAG: hypothetical protein PHR28_08680 [candidate division Zixibacteria bacterium]|nr:hypothetical protein [candidate division Zixibacteria bacterium]
MGHRTMAAGIVVLAIIAITAPSGALARAAFDKITTTANGPQFRPAQELPNEQFDVHNVGKLATIVTNMGRFGFGYLTADQTWPVLNGEQVPGAEYPINSNLEYLFSGSLWIGAVVGRDTLVSVAADGWFGMRELFPDPGDPGAIISRSSLRSKPTFDARALSEQDFICYFADTVTNTGLTLIDPFDNRPHIPLNVAIRQSSYAWSFAYTEDFVLFDYQITNIGPFPIKDMYIGLYIDGDVYHYSNRTLGPADDICGFRRTASMPPGYGIALDTVNIAWIADNDGDPSPQGGWAVSSPTGVTGTRVVRTPNPDLKYSFNWWVSNTTEADDFGPRLAGTADDPYRPFGSYTGTPTGDRNKYYIMRHAEFDYDQLFTAISHTSEGYLPPPTIADSVADGYDTRYLLSFGPFQVAPNDTLPITIAYVAGENFHASPDDFYDYYDANMPSAFYSKLDFTDLTANARWADWVYDNPGADTDGNGDSGRYMWRCPGVDSIEYYPELAPPSDSLQPFCTKVYYRGDGVPDFRAASPPPPPTLHIDSDFGAITVRWNGQEAENSRDIFSQEKDFEGYRMYMAQGERLSDYVLLAAYDRMDFKVFAYNPTLHLWEQMGSPLMLDSLQALYGADFDPAQYNSETQTFADQLGRQLYFASQDWNQSDLTNPRLIHRVYPEATLDNPADTTEEGLLRYYEYEYHIDDLLPSIPYYFAVTTFDFGSTKSGMDILESSPLINTVTAYALPSSEMVVNQGLKVIVYPNPYRIDGGYAGSGYENRDRTRSAERSRAIHFANLPQTCTIRIYTLAGDLVKEISHDFAAGGSESQHEVWDVVSRNTQAVATGIYLWQVDSEMGSQIGKLVIIK